jgi:hypothetical protein
VTVNNGESQSNLITRSFTVTVNAVNQPPTLNPIANLTLVKNAVAQTVALTGIGSGAPNETQSLKVTVSSSNSGLIPTPSVSYTSPKSTGSISFKPKANAVGSSTITVTVNDNGRSNNIVTRQFIVTVVAQSLAPVILNPLTNQVAVVGQTAAFSVVAGGTGPLKYQWKLNGVNLATATNAVLTLNNVTAQQAGAYSVSVSNSAGLTNSPAAALIVYPTVAANLTSAVKSNGQFTFNVSGVPTYKYIVQASSNLVDWTSIQTNTAPFQFTDPNASQFSQRYYRTLYLPQ